jgi:hypothetical protein
MPTRNEVISYINYLEIKHDINLSREARAMLSLPILEVQNNLNNDSINVKMYEKKEFEEEIASWQNSLEKIFSEMETAPAYIDKKNVDKNKRSSISVIKAYAKKFCNIPPFCGEK